MIKNVWKKKTKIEEEKQGNKKDLENKSREERKKR